METEIVTEFKVIRQASLYEIDKEGNIRKEYCKSPIIPIDGKVIVWNNYGEKVIYNVFDLHNQVFGNKIMAEEIPYKPKKIIQETVKQTEASKSINNNQKPQNTMSQTETTETQNAVDPAKVEKIKGLTCKKHVKIYKLHQLGMAKKEIASNLGTNVGACHNVIKDYEKTPEKVQKANEISID